ncbi:AAA family ATPase [Methylobacterium sp. E-016]|uniref:AAA family ATPase n=1 Tax=Methylobacterium sp. E-016 TaxID=2836556 RepID=UPI001FBAAB1C|nr:AAA family ATPase [Methylobacterium sp. E-016]MCJ2077904.1 AAA family ATPase [Methylobacterium sp. E-016]
MHALGPERAWPPLRGRAEDDPPGRPAIKATRFEWIEPSAIPVREWLLGRHLIRKFISATVSPGGIGKSSLVIAEALSMVTGRDLIGSQPHGRFKVWYINLEDPMDELQRRVMATALHYELDDTDLAGRLFVNSGRDTRVVVAEQNRAGLTIAHPVIEQIRATILANMIDVLIIDPFVSSHAVSENDNGAINAVATVWA